MKRIASSLGLGIAAYLMVISLAPWARAQQQALSAARLPRARLPNSYLKTALAGLRASERIRSTERLDLFVVRVSFSDRGFQEGSEPHDMHYYSNELRHLDEYFEGASGGRFHLSWVLYPEVIELGHPEGYYGEDGVWDERVVEMLMDVVGAIDESVDFSPFDAWAIIHAGAGQETDFNGDSPEQLWSGFVDPLEMAAVLADTLGTPGVPTNDTVIGDTVYIDNLMVLPEDASQDGMTFGSLGIYAYQVGLRLGMLPLFDTTPPDYPDSQGIGSFGLMAYGLYNAAGFVPAFPCAFNRYLMGWVEPVEAVRDGPYRITDINTGGEGDTMLVRVPINAAEYFLVTNRVHDSDFDGVFDFIDVGGDDPVPENEDTLRGAEFDFFLTATTDPVEYVEGPGGPVRRVLTGSGLMVWHVDESIVTRAVESGARPNDDPSMKGVDLEEADGVQDLDRPGGAFAFGSHYDSYREGNNTEFGTDTAPSSTNNAGVPSGVIVSDISAASHVMTFSLRTVRALPDVRGEIAGTIGGYAPLSVDLDGQPGEELVVAVSGGVIFAAAGAGRADWDGSADTLVCVPGVEWSAPPILADVTGDGRCEIFASSSACSLYAFAASGAPYGIDDTGSIGSVFLSASRCSAPMAFEADGDPFAEVIVLAQREEAIWAIVVGSGVELPVSGWISISPQVAAFPLLDGSLASQTARAVMTAAGGVRDEGIFFASVDQEGALRVHYVPFISDGEPLAGLSIETARAASAAHVESLLQPASGDIDRDGSDEMVLSAPGTGIVYWSPGRMIRTEPLRGYHPSPPALADVDGDGVLETAVRDERELYLFTGFGAPCSGWPLTLAESATAAELRRPPPPLIGEIDGDGTGDVLFDVSGDLYAFTRSGRAISGWPLPGEGGGAGAPVLLAGSGDELFIVTASSPPRIEGGEAGGIAYSSARTSLRRYDAGVLVTGDQRWPSIRHDAGGSGRQAPSNPSGTASYFVDAASFICYPNPSSIGQVTVRVVISGPAQVRVRIMTIEGEPIVDVARDHRWSAGSEVPFEEVVSTESMSSGIYVCHLEIHGDGGSWQGARSFAVVR